MTTLETLVVVAVMVAVIVEPYRRAHDRWTARRALRFSCIRFQRALAELDRARKAARP